MIDYVVLTYMIALLLQGIRLRYPVLSLKSVMCVGGFSLALHAIFLYQWFSLVVSPSFTALILFSLVAWTICAILIGLVFFRPVDVLMGLGFALALGSVALFFLYSDAVGIVSSVNHLVVIHVALSVVTVAVLVLAGVLSLLWVLQGYLLRTKGAFFFVSSLPPLETMESMIFELITLGFILLTTVIVSSLFVYYSQISTDLLLLKKTCLALLAWAIFAGLLWYRYRGELRGRPAIYGTSSGVLLLVIVYFGSQLLL